MRFQKEWSVLEWNEDFSLLHAKAVQTVDQIIYKMDQS